MRPGRSQEDGIVTGGTAFGWAAVPPFFVRWFYKRAVPFPRCDAPWSLGDHRDAVCVLAG